MKLFHRILLLICVLVCHSDGKELRRQTSELFEVASGVEWKLFTVDPTPFSTRKLFYLENTAAEFFSTAMTTSPFFQNQNIHMITFGVKDQIFDTTNDISVIRGRVKVLYSGEEIEDLSDALMKTVTNEDAENLRLMLARAGFFNEQSSLSTRIVFEPDGDSTLVATIADERNLFYILIGVVSLLVFIALAMLLPPLCKCRRGYESASISDLKRSTTEDTDGSFPLQGIGAIAREIPHSANAKSQYKFTPHEKKVRAGVINGYYPSESPYSRDSYTTDYPVDTPNSRCPLGITKMSALDKMMYEPKRQQKTTGNVAAMYNGIQDENDDVRNEAQYDETSAPTLGDNCTRTSM